MTETTFTITLAQLNPTVGDVTGNAAKARAARDKAKIDGADLLVLPELFIAGYPPEDLVLKPAFQAACRAAIEELARETADGGPAVLIGTPWVEDGKLYNACALLDQGRISRRFASRPTCRTTACSTKSACSRAVLPPGRSPSKASGSAFPSARTSGSKNQRNTKTSSNASPRPARKSLSCRTARPMRATRTICGCRSRSRASPKADCRWSISTRSAARTNWCSTARRLRSTPICRSRRNCRRSRKTSPRCAGQKTRTAGAARGRWRRCSTATRATTPPACSACAIMSARTVFPACCSAFPAASIRLCVRRSRSMRSAPKKSAA